MKTSLAQSKNCLPFRIIIYRTSLSRTLCKIKNRRYCRFKSNKLLFLFIFRMHESQSPYSRLDEESSIYDEKSDTENALLNDRDDSLKPTSFKSHSRRWTVIMVFHATVIAIYTVVTFLIINHTEAKHKHGPGLIYCKNLL